jgi:hypothetical protein
MLFGIPFRANIRTWNTLRARGESGSKMILPHNQTRTNVDAQITCRFFAFEPTWESWFKLLEALLSSDHHRSRRYLHTILTRHPPQLSLLYQTTPHRKFSFQHVTQTFDSRGFRQTCIEIYTKSNRKACSSTSESSEQKTRCFT